MRTPLVPNRLAHRRRLALGVLLLLVAATVAWAAVPAGAASAARPAPRLKDPAATGLALSTEYLTILQQGDEAKLAKFLDPAFQLQRADGTGADRAEYLANPAQIATFTIDEAIIARQHDDVLTVRWGVATNQTIDGVQYRTGTAPRISAYRWSGTRWRLVAHANFNLPS